jgi:ribosome biogenesis GTPase / thiamine phosphate phosphatase
VAVAPTTLTLPQLGWSGFFDEQLTDEERRTGVLGRIFSVQRSGVTVVFPGGRVELPIGGRWFKLAAETRPTIGDWVVLDSARQGIQRLLARRSVLRRVAAGREREVQLMAANVDTMFLVSSCNEEFNPSRIERYLALALDAGVEPVVVLTKVDLAADPDRFVREVRTLKRDLAVELVNARDERTLAGVRARFQPGQTVALLGSSGVGKSTLVNSLSGAQVQLTQAAREDDAKGRHTTTGRSLHVLPDGGLLVDNPGMRELLLADVDVTAAQVFDDVDALAAACRFRNCRHESEPGCAVRAAIDSGALEGRRLESYRKLATEEVQRARTVAVSRARPEAPKRQRHVQDPPEE